MKHEFLRRLSALALALVMAASLCAPAWAADGDPTTPDPGTGGGTGTGNPGTTTPAKLKLDQRLIILEDETTENAQELTLTGLVAGDVVEWTTTGNITVDGGASKRIEIPVDATDPISSTVKVSATSKGIHGEVSVLVTHTGNPVPEGTHPCSVYCASAPLSGLPENLSDLTAGDTRTITFTVDDDLAGFVEELGVTFSSTMKSVAGIGDTAEASAEAEREPGTSRFRVKIVGVAKGDAYIYMHVGGFSRRWSLKVLPKPGTIDVNWVGLEPNVLTMKVGETHAPLKVEIFPEDATDKTVTWSVDPVDSGVVTVDKDGNIKAIGPGSASIVATVGSVEGKCTVTVTETASNLELKIDKTVLEITDTDSAPTATITPELIGENKERVTIKWTSGSPSLVDFDRNGKASIETTGSDPVTIYGRKAGTSPVTITATATFRNAENKVTATKTAQCKVTVIDKDTVRILSMTLSTEKHTMPVDGELTLSVKSFTPSNAPAKGVRWSSSDPTIADVDPNTGKVTAHKAGQVAITATAEFGGAYKACRLTITPVAETITLAFDYDSNYPLGSNKYTYTFRNTGNDFFNVTANLGPTGSVDPIHWASENSSIATVSSSNTAGTKAVIRAIGPGKTKITAVPMDPKGKDRKLDSGPAEITLIISGLTLDRTSLTMMQGRRETIVATAHGAANNGDSSVDWISSDPSVVSVGSKNGESTALTARNTGTAVITATKGNYTVLCTVTVTEDNAGVISAGSTAPGVAVQFSKLTSQLQSACQAKTGAALSYVTSLSVASTDQGILHDRHHSTDDTGAGVGLQDRYYPGTAPQGERSLNDLSFVPRTTFSGTAEINYTAWATNNQSVSGVIRVTVNGTGDVTYSSGDGSVVNFLVSDFSRVHSNFRSVSFTPPQERMGVLYYKYTSPSQPGTRVTANDTYSRTGTPNLEDVSFVPAAGYVGTVKIVYKGTDTSGAAFSGYVTITVTGGSGGGATPADISYSVHKDDWVTIRPLDFDIASRYTLGEPLSYVRFTLPPSSDGTLFYNYRGFSNYDSMVSATTSYYYNGTPSLAGVSFVPTTTTPGQVDIPYTGYTTRGNTFSGTIHINKDSSSTVQDRLRYTVFTGKLVRLSASDFNSVCVAATGANLTSIQFTSLPGVSQGNLRYTRGNSSTPYDVTTGIRFFRTGTGTANLIGNLYFQSKSGYTGTVTIPFTGTSDKGVTFTDEVTIVVTPATSSNITYSTSTASPVQLSGSRILSASNGAMNSTLSYIIFSSLPSSNAGKLYLNYSGFGTGAQVSTGTRYYASGSPGVDQISFVPRSGFEGTAEIAYTGYSSSGEAMSGRIVISVTKSAASRYFNDMRNHTWAVDAVDYLYQNQTINGVGGGRFDPNGNISKGDFTLMLVRAFGFKANGALYYYDVPTNSYYYDAIRIANLKGIAGSSNGYFFPKAALTRQDAMVMIYNSLLASGRTPPNGLAADLSIYTDQNQIASYARPAIGSLVQLGVVKGNGNGTLNPRGVLTRAETAMLMHAIMTL